MRPPAAISGSRVRQGTPKPERRADNHPVVPFGDGAINVEVERIFGRQGQHHKLPTLTRALIFGPEIERSPDLLAEVIKFGQDDDRHVDQCPTSVRLVEVLTRLRPNLLESVKYQNRACVSAT